MKREAILQLLQKYSPLAPEEILFKEEILLFVKKHERCFERSLEIGHVTASAWLVNKEKSKVLLMHHAKLDRWFQLGGHCDGNPDVLGVAIREAQEESGIINIKPVLDEIFDIDIHLIPDNGREPAHHHYDIRFLLYVASEEKVVKNHESKQLSWIGLNQSELPTNSLAVVRMYNKWKNFIHLDRNRIS